MHRITNLLDLESTQINEDERQQYDISSQDISVESQDPSRSGHALSEIHQVIRASRTTINGAGAGLGELTFIRIFPKVAPAAARPTLYVSTGFMGISSVIGIMDMTGSKRLIKPRILWNSAASGFGAYTFSFASAGSLYAAILESLNWSPDEIDDSNSLANQLALGIFTASCATLGMIHTTVKYKNESQRLAIEEAKANGVADEDLPKLSTLAQITENFTNIFIIASTLHSMWANFETFGENGTLNEDPSILIPRYVTPIVLGAVTFVVNIVFKNKPARAINEFIGYLNSIDIALVLGSLLQSGLEDGEHLSDEERILFLAMWPTLVAIPLIYKLGEVCLAKICARRQDYQIITDNEDIEYGDPAGNDDIESEEDEDNDIKEDTESKSEESEEEDSALLARHARFFTEVSHHKYAGDLHKMKSELRR